MHSGGHFVGRLHLGIRVKVAERHAMALTLAGHDGSTAFDVGYQQREGLRFRIAEGRHRRMVRPRLACAFRDQIRGLAADSFFRIFIGIVKTWQIGRNRQYAGHGKHTRGYPPAAHLMTAYRPHQIGDGEAGYHKQEIIGHLHMVARYLEHTEEGRNRRSREVTAAVGEHHARYCRRDIGQCDEFPYMAGIDDDDEIARKAVGHGAYQSDIPPHLHRHQQDEEAEHHQKKQVGRLGQTERQHVAEPREQRVGGIARGYLKRGHAA